MVIGIDIYRDCNHSYPAVNWNRAEGRIGSIVICSCIKTSGILFLSKER